MTELTFTSLRRQLTALLDRAANEHEGFIIRRRGKPSVAIIPADELGGLMETLHLLRSTKNSHRLFSALSRVPQAEAVAEIPRGSRGSVELKGILRLRSCFAPRSNYFAQDDNA